MVVYICHIIWRFIKYQPDEYKLLDARHNVMKNLILGDCDYLIKFILFESDGNPKEIHIPRSILWNRKKNFVKNDDLTPFENDDKIIRKYKKPKNDMELAIYHCKGKLIFIFCKIIYINRFNYFIFHRA